LLALTPATALNDPPTYTTVPLIAIALTGPLGLLAAVKAADQLSSSPEVETT